MSLVFVASAVVQWNDPDPFVWMALYGSAALLAALVASGRDPRWRPALEAAVFAGCVFFVLALAPALFEARVEAVTSLRMQSAGDERVRELGGSVIVLLYAATLVVRRARARGVARGAIAAAASAGLLLVAARAVLSTPDSRPPPRVGPPDRGLSGPEVAERYCQSCHLLPSPAQLPKQAWPFVVDWMGNYLGYRKLYGPFEHITGEDLIPPEPLISVSEMDRLGRWLIAEAPAQHDFRILRPPNPPIVGYRARVVEGAGPPGGVVTLVEVDEARGRLYVGTANERRLRVFDRDARLLQEIALAADPIHVEVRASGIRLTTSGDFEFDRQRSRVIDFFFGPDGAVDPERTRVRVSGYHRAVHTRSGDLDGDGVEDMVLVGFGDGVGPGHGRVSIFWSTPFDADADGPAQEQVLFDAAGALGAWIADIDEDGRQDVIVLRAQGRNQLIAFLGRGERRFEQRVLLEEHVSIGYNAFELHDFDGDGHLDLLLTNGNNMEMLDPPLRPYHGVRIALGDGALGFREVYRYPMYGAMTTVARDLDGDGDRDLLVNAFYPDWSASEPETLTLLENLGDLHFEARSLGGDHWGRWLRIAAGDLDGDGDVDLFAGAGNLPGGGLHPGRPRLYERYRRRLSSAPALLELQRE